MIANLIAKAEATVQTKITNKEAFTVRDITRSVRAVTTFDTDPAQEVKHDEVRAIVRRVMDSSIGDGYETSRARLGASPEPIVYHPPGADLTAFGINGQQPVGSPAQNPKPQSSMTSWSPAPTTKLDSRIRKITRRGRITIPRAAIRSITGGKNSYTRKLHVRQEGHEVYIDNFQTSKGSIGEHMICIDGDLQLNQKTIQIAGFKAEKYLIEWDEKRIWIKEND